MLTRVDFNPQDFNDIIQQKGYNLQWEQSVICPCIDLATKRGVSGCPQCNEKGRYYFQTTKIKGIITRQNKEVQIGDALGVLEPGDAYLTVPASIQLTEFDRIINLDSIAVYSEVVIHSETQEDALRYPPIGNVIGAFIQPTRHSNIVTLKQNVDFTIDSMGVITWISAVNKPKDNTGVSFRYNRHPSWIVLNTPNYIRDTLVLNGNPTDTFTAMPIRVQIRLEQFSDA